MISKRNEIATKSFKMMTREDLGKIYRDARDEMSQESDFVSSCSSNSSCYNSNPNPKNGFLTEENIQLALQGLELKDFATFTPTKLQLFDKKDKNRSSLQKRTSIKHRRKSILEAQNDFHSLLKDQTENFNQQLLQKVVKEQDL